MLLFVVYDGELVVVGQPRRFPVNEIGFGKSGEFFPVFIDYKCPHPVGI